MNGQESPATRNSHSALNSGFLLPHRVVIGVNSDANALVVYSCRVN